MSLIIEKNNLFNTIKEWYLFVGILCIIFLINIASLFLDYRNITSIEVFNTDAKVLNIYPKKDYYILKVKTNNFSCYTSINNNDQNITKLDSVNIDLISSNISFFDYLKGFYAPSFNVIKLNENKTKTNTIFNNISLNIYNQHENKIISELFNALFLGIPINSELRAVCIDFGVSHLIALSGFHLGVLAFLIYWIFYFPYKIIHQKYFPYRNKRFDLLILTSLFLLSYLLFLGLIPSLLRAFVMYIFVILLYRNNIKIISYQTLAITLLSIISFLPTLIFSLSLWLSIFGVFYIFLFLQYFSKLNKVILFIVFNFWIFLALNPIIHYFFDVASFYQIYSAIFTIGFSLFYPVELFLHSIGYGDLFDPLIQTWLNISTTNFKSYTSIYFFIFYILISLFSTNSKRAFILLNLLFLGFNITMFVFV